MKTIQKQQLLLHPIDKVWEAISQAEQISAWFIQADFEAKVGYAYTFTHEETKITGVVKEAEPYTLIYTWMVNNDGTSTTVKWELEKQGNQTLLKLEHSGISNYPDEQTAINMMGHFDKGWDNCISGLIKYFN